MYRGWMVAMIFQSRCKKSNISYSCFLENFDVHSMSREYTLACTVYEYVGPEIFAIGAMNFHM